MVETGKRYRLTRSEGIGNPSDGAFVQPGIEITVRETVSAAEPGAYDNTEDSVVCLIDVPYVTDDNGELKAAIAQRAFSVSVDDFNEWFEAVV